MTSKLRHRKQVYSWVIIRRKRDRLPAVNRKGKKVVGQSLHWASIPGLLQREKKEPCVMKINRTLQEVLERKGGQPPFCKEKRKRMKVLRATPGRTIQGLSRKKETLTAKKGGPIPSGLHNRGVILCWGGISTRGLGYREKQTTREGKELTKNMGRSSKCKQGNNGRQGGIMKKKTPMQRTDGAKCEKGSSLQGICNTGGGGTGHMYRWKRECYQKKLRAPSMKAWARCRMTASSGQRANLRGGKGGHAKGRNVKRGVTECKLGWTILTRGEGEHIGIRDKEGCRNDGDSNLLGCQEEKKSQIWCHRKRGGKRGYAEIFILLDREEGGTRMGKNGFNWGRYGDFTTRGVGTEMAFSEENFSRKKTMSWGSFEGLRVKKKKQLKGEGTSRTGIYSYQTSENQ